MLQKLKKITSKIKKNKIKGKLISKLTYKERKQKMQKKKKRENLKNKK